MEICSICNQPAQHSSQSGENTTWLCCAHYQKLYKPKKRCSHEPTSDNLTEYITEDHGIMYGRRVFVSYKITSPEESARIQKQIRRILNEALRKMELEAYKEKK